MQRVEALARQMGAVPWSQIVEEAKGRGVREVAEDELHDMLRANPDMKIIDIREESEVARMPIPHWWRPMEIPRGVLERNIGARVKDLDTELVIVCAAGMRSVMAAETLMKMNYTRVYSLKGGAAVLCRGHPMYRGGVCKGFQEAVGNTPLIRLNKISDETGCEILGKAEYMNPGPLFASLVCPSVCSVAPVPQSVSVALLPRPLRARCPVFQSP